MASVSVEDVWDTLNVGDSELPAVKVQKMITRAAMTLGLELSKEVDVANCSGAEKEFITLLAAVYGICFLTGGSAVGMNFSVGDLQTSNAANVPPLEVFQTQLEKILNGLKRPYVGSA